MSDDRSIEIIGIIQKSKNKSVRCFDVSYKQYSLASNNLSKDSNLIIACKLTQNKVQYFFVDLFAFRDKYELSVTNWEELRIEIETHVTDEDFYKVLTYTSVPSMQWFKSPDPLDESATKIYCVPTKFSSNMLERPFVYGLNYTDYVSVAYTNIKFPHIRNKYDRRKSLPDLVFTKNKGKNINLENTLVSVNGITGLPIYDSNKKELYIKNGANMLRDAHYTDQNIVLMDFSKLLPEGVKLQTHRLYNCAPDLYFKMIQLENNKVQNPVTLTSITGSTIGEQKYATLKHTLETFLDRSIDYQRRVDFGISFSVPIENNGYEKIPLLCLGGRLFFPSVDNLTYSTSEDKKYLHVIFEVPITVLEKILAANLQHNGVFYGFTSIYRLSIGYIVSNLFTNKELNAKFSSDEWKIIANTTALEVPFISIIQTEKHVEIDEVEQYSTKNEKTICFPKFAHGILINKKTREIVDYTARPEDDIVNVSITPQNSLYISELEGSMHHKDKENITRTEIPDAMRYDRLAWENHLTVYSDHYNQFEPGEFLKDIHSFVMLNILAAPNKPIVLFDKNEQELPEPEIPSYGSEYRVFKYPVKKLEDKKIVVSSKDSTTNGKHDVFITGLPEQFSAFEKTYKYNSSSNEWEYSYSDGSRAVINYNEEAYAWILTYIKSDNTSATIMQSKGTIEEAPYRNGVIWVFCGKEGFIPQEDPEIIQEVIEDEGDPED